MLNSDEKKIIKAIPEGADHPRSMKEVARVTNMDARKVRLIVTSLAARSYPIGGNHHKPTGYFWATNDEELELAIRPIASQVKELQRRLAGLRWSNKISKDEALAEPTSDDKKAKEA